jgi:pyruvate dehydrogenase E2 component (dihydrolipoamide acetyltransferase)
VAQAFRLPDLGEGIHEADIVDILVSEGDEVEEGQEVLTVETDKATVDIPSPTTATVEEIHVAPDQLVQVGDVLITFSGGQEGAEPEEEGEVPEREAAPPQQEEGPPPQEGEERAAPSGEPGKSQEEAPMAGRAHRQGPVPASPSTRRLARELEVDLREVPPSAPAGRVTAEDVRAFAEGGQEAPQRASKPGAGAAPEEREGTPRRRERPSVRPSEISAPALPDFTRWGPVERVPLRSVRRTIAQRMARAWSQVPHVSHQDVADITELEELRQRCRRRVEEQGGQLTLTALAMKAAVAALREHPRFNASLDPEAQEIVLKSYYHLGIAVDTEQGLIVPVIRDVDRKSLTELAIELAKLAERTRQGQASLEDLSGGTFTITNVGPIGGTAFLPIINYPQAAILGMARARWQPAVLQVDDGEEQLPRIVPRYLLPLVLSFDHRIVDGADAARFMRSIVSMLEDPDKLLLSL